MKLKTLLKKMDDPPPYFIGTSTDGESLELGTADDNARVAIIVSDCYYPTECCKLNATYLNHAANVLPYLADVLKQLSLRGSASVKKIACDALEMATRINTNEN